MYDACMIELYFGPGACSFVPHVALERIKAVTGQAFEPKLVKLHKNEQKNPEYLKLNPNGQVRRSSSTASRLPRSSPSRTTSTAHSRPSTCFPRKAGHA